MFGEPVFFASQHVRSGTAQLFSEFVATFGLLSVIWGCARLRSSAVPFAVGAYITAAYWFTASTSFANPVVTLARAASDTFAGIRPIDAPGFIVAQLVGAPAATALFRWLVPRSQRTPRRWWLNIHQRKECMPDKKRVLILCTGNSARSQMAEGLLRHDAGDRFEVFSAGTRLSRVRPEAIAVMRELGVDISSHRSKSVDEFADQKFDYVLTVCDNAKESCPIFPGQAIRIHQSFEDPAELQGSNEERLALFRRIRDELRTYLFHFPRT